MSYEGYEQHICAHGHLFTNHDIYSGMYSDLDVPVCHCGQKSVFSNSVDETNCDSFGIITPEEFQKYLVKEAVYQECNLGHHHLVSHAVYRIPEQGFERYFRMHDDNYLEVQYADEYWNNQHLQGKNVEDEMFSDLM